MVDRAELKKLIRSFLIALIAIGIAGALFGCKTYVPVETVRTEVEYNDRWRVDTIERTRDRIVYQKGDTVYDKSTEYVYKVKELHDSIYLCRTDSIEVPYPVEVPCPVERELTSWQRFRLDAFGWLCGALALCLVWLLRRPLLSILTKRLT